MLFITFIYHKACENTDDSERKDRKLAGIHTCMLTNINTM